MGSLAGEQDVSPDVDSAGVYFISVEDFEARKKPAPIERPPPRKSEKPPPARASPSAPLK